MTAVEASSFPSFQRRGGRAAAGVVSKRSRSAPYFSLKLLTTPSAPLRNGIFLLRRSHPSLKTEGNELASTAVIDFEIACLKQSPTGQNIAPLKAKAAAEVMAPRRQNFGSDHHGGSSLKRAVQPRSR